MQDEATPMDLDMHERQRNQNRNKSKFQGRCFVCGDKGHMARDCHHKIQKVNEFVKESYESDELGKGSPQ